jgi:hypothetical protein
MTIKASMFIQSSIRLTSLPPFLENGIILFFLTNKIQNNGNNMNKVTIKIKYWESSSEVSLNNIAN